MLVVGLNGFKISQMMCSLPPFFQRSESPVLILGSPGFSSSLRVSFRRSFGGLLDHRRSVFNRRHPSKPDVRTALVVISSPRLDLGPGVGQRQEPVGVQALVTKAAVERLDEDVVGRLS